MKIKMLKALRLMVAITVLIIIGACGVERLDAPRLDASITCEMQATKKVQVALDIWTQFGDLNSQDGNYIAFYKTLNAIKAALPDITLKHDGASGDIYKTKLKTAMAANELPDIFFTWGGGFGEPIVKGGLALPLDDYIKDGTMDKLIPGTLTNFTYDGKVYGLPYSIATANLYCNKALFDQNNLKLPETYDDLIAAIKTFSSKGITPMALGEKDLWPGLMIFGIMAERSVGAKVFNDTLAKKASYDTPEMIAGAQKVKELSDLKAFGANPLGTSYDDSDTAFKAGKTAMFFMGTWVNGEFESDGSKVKGKIVPIKFPTLTGGKGASTEFHGGCGETFMISSNSKYKDQAVKALKFLCENMSKEQYLAGSGAPAWKGDMGDTSKLNALSVKTSDLTKDATGFVYWLDMMTEAKDAETIKNSIASLVGGKDTPEQFCKDLQKMNSAK